MVRLVKQAQAAPAGVAKRLPGRPARRPVVGADLVSASEADNYGGVVALLGADRRLSINGKANRYGVQLRVGSSWRWGLFLATRSALLARFPADADLAAAVADLPELPCGLCPDFVRDRKRQAAAFKVTNWERDDFSGVVAHVEDWRLVVDPKGESYMLMYVPGPIYAVECVGRGWDCWQPLAIVSTLAGLRRFFDLAEIGDAGSGPMKLLPALVNVPEVPNFALVAHLPERPSSVRRQRLAARPSGGPSGVVRRAVRSKGL